MQHSKPSNVDARLPCTLLQLSLREYEPELRFLRIVEKEENFASDIRAFHVVARRS